MPKIILPAGGWVPRPYQMKSWQAWERGCKRLLLCWHRRAGKDEVSLHIAAIAMHLRPANYWHCLPEFSSARRAIWEAVNPHTGKKRIDEAFPQELRTSTRNDTMTIEFKSGSVWRVVGSDNPDSLVGAPPAGIVFSEWAISNPSAWGYLAPILDENGGWATFISTPRGRNHFKTMLDMARGNPGWFSEVLTVKDTGYPVERVEAQRKEYHAIFGIDAGDALIEQEYYCSFEAAILGAYWAKEISILEHAGRITEVEPYEDAPVHTAWDLGIREGVGAVRDSMVIWFWQAVPGPTGQGQIRVLGCYSAHGYGIPHYAEVIEQRALAWGYKPGIDYVPHDAKQREMGAFNADKSSSDYGKAKQRLEVMLECGLKPQVVMDHDVADGISAVRQVLPRCWFDEVACEKGLEGLRQYQSEWDDRLKIFRATPLHSWASHYADAFRMMAMAYREMAPEQIPLKPAGLIVGQNVSPGFRLPSMSEVIAAQEERPRGWRI